MTTGPVAPLDRAATRCDVRSPLVLDLVFVAAVVALFALVGAVAAGVERL
ncbi:hypothetical protein [Cellulomonas triticagri]|nr:hypothetical protein [Cellulomonas triticagri]